MEEDDKRSLNFENYEMAKRSDDQLPRLSETTTGDSYYGNNGYDTDSSVTVERAKDR